MLCLLVLVWPITAYMCLCTHIVMVDERTNVGDGDVRDVSSILVRLGSVSGTLLPQPMSVYHCWTSVYCLVGG